MSDTTIPQLVAEQARRHPDREALVDAQVRLTYGQFDQQIRRVCRAAMRWGIEPGDHVAMWAPNSATYLVTFNGLMAAGAVVVPMNTRFKGHEGATAIRRAQARLLFTVTDYLDTDYVEMLRRAAPDLVALAIVTLDDGRTGTPGVTPLSAFMTAGEAVTDDDARARIAAGDPSATAYVILTSGTTGEPKGVRLSHRANLLCAASMVSSFALRDAERVFFVLPLFHIFGLNGGYLITLLTGGCSVISSVFEATEVMRLIERERITFLPGPPTVHQSILDAPDRGGFDLSTVRTALIGSTTVPGVLVHRIVDEGLADHVVAGYGLTEAGGVVAVTRVPATADEVASYAGTVLDTLVVRVLDDAGRDVAPGEPGEFLVRSPTLMDGYIGDPEATARAIDADGWLHTGDVGTVDERGRLRVTDRKKDMFIVGGFNAYPAEIEHLFGRHPGIAQVAVVGMPDERLGEVGAAFVVAHDPALLPHQVIAWARQNMANYKVPRHVEIVDALPLGPSLKISKAPLRDRAAAAAALAVEPAA